MASKNIPSPATFRNLGDFRVLLITLEQLTVAALDESDGQRRSALLWSMQKNIEAASKDIELLEVATG